jgi:hypothetical protein
MCGGECAANLKAVAQIADRRQDDKVDAFDV